MKFMRLDATAECQDAAADRSGPTRLGECPRWAGFVWKKTA
jgi:hypothetical protein